MTGNFTPLDESASPAMAAACSVALSAAASCPASPSSSSALAPAPLPSSSTQRARGRTRKCSNKCLSWDAFYLNHGNAWMLARLKMDEAASKCCHSLQRQLEESFEQARLRFQSRVSNNSLMGLGDSTTSHPPPNNSLHLSSTATPHSAPLPSAFPPLPSPLGFPPSPVGASSSSLAAAAVQPAAALGDSSSLYSPLPHSLHPSSTAPTSALIPSSSFLFRSRISLRLPPLPAGAPSTGSAGASSSVSTGGNGRDDFERLLAVLRDGKPNSGTASGSTGSTQLSSGSEYDGFISYRHQLSGEAIMDAPPFGITAAGMVRLVAEKFDMRLWQDVEDMPTSCNWTDALQAILQSCKIVFVLLWDGCLERCSDPSDPMRVEILTALRRPQCFVVPLVFFADRVDTGGLLPLWLNALVARHAAVGAAGADQTISEDDADSLHIYYGLLQQQCVFFQKQHIARSLESFFAALPSRLGVHRHAAAGCDTLDKLGVTVGMSRKQLEACFASHVQTNKRINPSVQSAIEQLQQLRRAAASKLSLSSMQLQPRISLLSWNMFGGGSRNEADPIEHLVQVLRTFPSDVLALQEAPWGVVAQLAELGYTLQQAELVYTERWLENQASGGDQGRRPGAKKKARLSLLQPLRPPGGYDVCNEKHRTEQYNVLAVRLVTHTSSASHPGVGAAATATAAAAASTPSSLSSSSGSTESTSASSSYLPLSLLQATFPLSAIELSRLPTQYREEDGEAVEVNEHRSLQLLQLAVALPLLQQQQQQQQPLGHAATEVDSPVAQAVSRPLCIWNTHLEVADEPTRWKSAQRIMNELDFHAQQQQKKKKKKEKQGCSKLASAGSKPGLRSAAGGSAIAMSSSSSSASSAAAAAAPAYSAQTANHVLVGDLNALSRGDYSAAEVAFHGRVESFLSGAPAGPSRTCGHSWRVMDLLEEDAYLHDLYQLAHQPRPKISVWSCRRVDHALAYPNCQWTPTFASQIFTTASDHLPQFFILEPSMG